MRRRTLALPLACIALAGAAAPALADSSESANWAGYAVHGASFRVAQAVWTEPGAVCRSHKRTYSAVWVGIGGFSEASNALEQIGTEADCTATGSVQSSAWYELVPEPSEPVRMSVHPGDQMLAGVEVTGHRAVLTLADATRREWFSRSFHARSVDTSSAEWIVEAPSLCSDSGPCEILPLANFRTVSFVNASAQLVTGHTGSIVDPAWSTTDLTLRPDPGELAMMRRRAVAASGANTSALSAAGSSFSVAFTPLPLAQQVFGPRLRLSWDAGGARRFPGAVALRLAR